MTFPLWIHYSGVELELGATRIFLLLTTEFIIDQDLTQGGKTIFGGGGGLSPLPPPKTSDSSDLCVYVPEKFMG